MQQKIITLKSQLQYQYLESIKIRCRGEFLSEKQIFLKFIVSEIKKILSNLRLHNKKLSKF